ncbi:hypothetical protein SAMN05421736_101750 [Evansella caseinilytica]|uniref:Sublancin immunity protein SunI-like PH domain-containing protein n=1 Tax=Evansella caseinilytica TaxID=1503961 RepID=A0A1H3IA18_9BACI|nr:hypothetical protein [Evansella caseinilytica]SDY24038.1 hypothetical protein SAMN05421736_101750 [Evansella caseinilytica]
MFELNVEKSGENLLIKWQLSKVDIPLADITEVFIDETYGGENPAAVRIGFPYGNTDRIVIQTKTAVYILFTSSPSLADKINSFRKTLAP